MVIMMISEDTRELFGVKCTYFTQFFGSFQHRHLGTGLAHCNSSRQTTDPRTNDADVYLTRTLTGVSSFS